MKTIKLTGGLDIGNGYVKGMIEEVDRHVDQIDLPSSVAVVTKPNRLFTPDHEAVSVMADANAYYNSLDVSFVTPLIPSPHRRLFGTRGLASGSNVVEFDVIGHRSKAEQVLSFTLVLGLFAGKALRDYVRAHGELPPADEALSVDVAVALALPITEYMAHRGSYADAFKNGIHTATIHNFETPVTVKLSFKNVAVIAEGASAQVAITAKGEPLMAAMLADMRSRGVPLDPDITPADVLAARNTIGVDIGEGTVNFPVFTQGKFNADASSTFNKGYGTALSNAIETMEQQRIKHGMRSRKELAEYLQSSTAIRKTHMAHIMEYVNQEVEFFAADVAEQFERVFDRVGPMTEVVYVYGGGAAQIKEELYPLLLQKIVGVSQEDVLPVLYLDSYSRYLNREGLFMAAQRLR